LALVRHIDSAGWDGAYLCDHFMPFRADGLAADAPMLECWTTLAVLAGQTRRLRLGTLVLGNTFRHPAVVANMAATMSRASGGRFVLGLGAGGQANEHTAYGVELGAIKGRLDRFEEACAVIRSLLEQPRTTLHGKFYRLTDAPCEPKPPTPVPLLIGGGGERRTLRIAARFADEWHTWGTVEEFGRKCEILDRHCADIGRDPSTIARVTGAEVSLATGAPSRNGDFAADHRVGGTAQRVLDWLAAYQTAGAEEFVVRDDADTAVAAAQDELALFWDQVAGHLR
jgi:F420-dependent oxidoreductase-like protein